MKSQKITRTIEITIEKIERMVSKSAVSVSTRYSSQCPFCARECEFAAPSEFRARGMGQIYRMIGTREIGILESREGNLLVCRCCIESKSTQPMEKAQNYE